MTTTTTDSTVLIFKCICQFIKDVSDVFGKGQKSLLLYSHLIEKTGIIHEEPIRKHILCFHEFVKTNEEGILNRDFDAFKKTVIRYSEKVYIDLADIFRRADAEEKEAIWKHLMTLLAVLDPSSQAKKILLQEQERKRKRGDTGNEEKFLTNIIDKVNEHMDPAKAVSGNPAEMMQQLMGSGMFNELVDNMNSGLTNGDLDLGRMIGSLQSMMGNLSQMLETPQTSGGGNTDLLLPNLPKKES